jgi:mono/diheme cytochrome c family protein
MKKPMLCLIGALTYLAAGRTSAQDLQRGKEVFDLWCSGCHKPLGPYVSSVAGTSVLQRKYKGSKPAALEDRTDLLPAVVKTFVRHGVKFMPNFRKTEISDSDLNALATYLARNSGQQPKGSP